MLDQDAAIKNGDFIEGDSYRWALEFVDRSSGLPVDLTGLGFRATLYVPVSVNPNGFVLGIVSVINAEAGRITVDFSRYSQDMPVGSYKYSVVAIDQSGYTLTLVRGCIDVNSQLAACQCEENQYA
jgi:hypothetical protein